MYNAILHVCNTINNIDDLRTVEYDDDNVGLSWQSYIYKITAIAEQGDVDVKSVI